MFSRWAAIQKARAVSVLPATISKITSPAPTSASVIIEQEPAHRRPAHPMAARESPEGEHGLHQHQQERDAGGGPVGELDQRRRAGVAGHDLAVAVGPVAAAAGARPRGPHEAPHRMTARVAARTARL